MLTSLVLWPGRCPPPEIGDAKGSIKIRLNNGVLAKYEYKVSGKMSFQGNEREIDRTTTVEIKDSGATQQEVPEDAAKKLS